MVLKNLLLLLSAGIAFISCLNTAPALPPPISPTIPHGFVEKSLCLTENHNLSLARVTLSLPTSLDTLLIWDDTMDDGTIRYHRFINKNRCLIQESGFFKYHHCTDSIQRLTIGGVKSFDHNNKPFDQSFVGERALNETMKSLDLNQSDVHWKATEIRVINGQVFAMLHSVGSLYYGKPLEKIELWTKINGWHFNFCWECVDRDCTDFIKNAYLTIPTIQIDTICKQ